MNKDSLYYLERLDAFEIMETHIMDRLMQEYWQSSLDAGGSFFEDSTVYGILTNDHDGWIQDADQDFEHEHRFYRKGIRKS